MNNNYDQNQYDQNGQYCQQPQYDAQYGQYDAQYQQTQYDTQYGQFDNQYQEPVPESKVAPSPVTIMVLGIVGLALSSHWWVQSIGPIYGLAGLIVSAIGLSKVRAYVEAGLEVFGRAKLGKIFATIGLIVGIVSTALAVTILTFYFGYIGLFSGLGFLGVL